MKSGLVKKPIIDKRGRRTSVWVRADKPVKNKSSIRNLNKFLKGSKVKNIVYHGTDKKFDEFDPESPSNAWMGDFPEGAMFFTSSKDRAKLYGNIQMPLYVKMENPLVVNLESGTPEDFIDYEDKLWSDYYDGFYDGIIVNGWDIKAKKTTVYIMFDERGIKSAKGNNGDFDERKPNIYK
jgi:hypothetical protein